MAAIYKIKNDLNGKFYVGFTARNVNVRWKEHQKLARFGSSYHLSHAIRKHGSNAFTVSILEENLNPEMAKEIREPYWISILKPEYNMTDGGEGCSGWKPTPEQRKHASQIHLGVPLSLAHRQALRGPKSLEGKKNMLGTKTAKHARSISVALCNSEKFKNSMRILGESRRGKSRPPSVGLKVSKAKMGHSVSSATRSKISVSLKGRINGPHALVTSPHCGKIGGNNSMPRWHFNNCKKREVQ